MTGEGGEEEKDGDKRSLMRELLKEAGAFSLALYAAGFLSVRAWLNFLGVWTGPPLIDQTYLAEGGAFVMATAEALFYPWGLVAVLTVTLVVAVQAFARKRSSLGRWAARFGGARWREPLGLSVVLGCSLLVRKVLFRDLPLPSAILLAKALPPLPDPAHYPSCVGVVTAVAMVWCALRRKWIVLGRFHRVVQIYLAGLAGLGMFLLPIQFARTAKDRTFPVARVTVDGRSEGTSFLLLETDKELVVYDGTRIRTMDSKHVETVDVRCHALIDVGPTCPAWEGGSAPDEPPARGDAAPRDGGPG